MTVEDLIGEVVKRTDKNGVYTAITFVSGNVLILTDRGITVTRTSDAPMVIA